MALDVAKQNLINAFESESSTSPTSTTLLHELQLGEQLNKSVHQARRADFSLMLAMLCDDVREQSQFVLPQHELAEKTLSSDSLRQQFQLPKQSPLALETLEHINAFNQAQYVSDNSLTDMHLTDIIQPKALAFRDDARHIPSSILTNTTLICQDKHRQGKENAVLNKRADMNVQAWLQNIQTSLVKSRLSTDITA